MFKRILAALGAAMLATIGGATTAGAVERQPLDGPLNVQVSDDSGRIPEALRVGSPGTVSALYGAPGAWAVTHSDPYTGEPGVGGWGTFINVYRVLPYDGAGFGSSDRQNVCDGEFVGGPEQYSDQSGGSLGVPRDPYPAIDLSTVSWIAKGYSEGYLIPSNEYIDDDSWNPNLDGLVWRPATHMEEIRFADIRMDAPGEGNASFSVVVSTYYTPGWDCGDDPFVPETGDEPESTPEPPVEDEPEPTPEPTAEAVPDEGRTPKGQVIALDVLANDDRVVELVSVGDLTPADAGLVTVEDGQAVFEPSPEFVGVATFAYEGHSPEGLVRGATATVTVFESDPEPELTPEPEPEPDPEPEPTPEVPVVDEPEPVIPFAPSTGIEVDEPSSSSALGWALIGSGLSLGAATWFAARRWL